MDKHINLEGFVVDSVILQALMLCMEEATAEVEMRRKGKSVPEGIGDIMGREVCRAPWGQMST